MITDLVYVEADSEGDSWTPSGDSEYRGIFFNKNYNGSTAWSHYKSSSSRIWYLQDQGSDPGSVGVQLGRTNNGNTYEFYGSTGGAVMFNNTYYLRLSAGAPSSTYCLAILQETKEA